MLIISVTGTVSSLSYPTLAGLRSDLIKDLGKVGLQPSGVVLNTTLLGSIEFHYDISGTVTFPDSVTEDPYSVAFQVGNSLLYLTGYQATASPGADSQTPLSDVVLDPIHAATSTIGKGIDTIEQDIASFVKGATDAAAQTAQHVERDVLIVAGLIIVGIVVIAFSPHIGKIARAAV
jgi:hypothetical protein